MPARRLAYRVHLGPSCPSQMVIQEPETGARLLLTRAARGPVNLEATEPGAPQSAVFAAAVADLATPSEGGPVIVLATNREAKNLRSLGLILTRDGGDFEDVVWEGAL